MLILSVEPGKVPEAKEISGSLQEMQELVGGHIQTIYPFEEPIALVCNEEGLFLGLPANRGLRDKDGKLYDIICGVFFLCGSPADEESFTSLSPEEVERFERRFNTPEIFVGMAGRIVCLPME